MEKYHFIAIGGIGMSGLAKYLLEYGYEVSGSDIFDSKYTEKLKKMGAKIFVGHKEENLPEDCKVIVSSVIKEDNPELQKAKNLNLPILHRSDLLNELAEKGQFFIGYSGTHGKTTTSGLSAYVLEKAGLKPSFAVGGIIPEINTNAKYDSGKCFVAELDESDGTIVRYSPEILVINNLEIDHIDFYTEGVDSLIDTFNKFLAKLKPCSKVILNADCKVSQKLKSDKIITFGLNKAEYSAKNIKTENGKITFDIYKSNKFLTDLAIQITGEHNIYNALAVVTSLNEAGTDVNLIKPHFATFTGMGRRFQHIGKVKGALLYDDYAHHPTEIKATVNALKGFKGKNLIAVFQPHRYTRLQFFWKEFLNSFDGVDKVIITDVYSASEPEIEGINSENFAKALFEKSKIPCEYISGNIKDVAKILLPALKDNDVLVGMGAGTITDLASELINLYKEV